MKTKVLIFCWFFAMFSLLLEASDAVVANYTGKVLVWQDNKWKNITKKGLILKEKDKIKTLNKSKVILLFKNGSTIIIGENSQVTIYELLNNISLILDEGEIRSQVIGLQQNQTFEVKTPISVASVRGTEFILSHIGNQTELIVVEGKVTLYDNSGNSYSKST
ncbi:MAG: FecR family protein [Endomicrobiia bacterium]